MHLGLPLRRDEVDVDFPLHLSGAAADEFGVDLESEGDWDLSDILP